MRDQASSASRCAARTRSTSSAVSSAAADAAACAEPAAGAYAKDLTKLYTTFQPRAPATQTSPFAVEEESAVDDSELPF